MIFDPSKTRALILDMDGVLWRGEQPISDLPAIFTKIKHKNLKVMLATNNATRTPEQHLAKLATFGVDLEPWQAINSAEATAHYLGKRFPDGGFIFVVGEPALHQALEKMGFQHQYEGAPAVVASMDRGINYEKVRQATLVIRGGALFIGTNPDLTFPTPEGQVPGAGAILALLEAATDVKPTIIGKPNPDMYQVALDRLGTTPEETLIIGDRLETDIAGAQALGSPCALVLSGVTTEAQAWEWDPLPDLIAENLASILREFV
jgi:4-nitrophenyl phosphatase